MGNAAHGWYKHQKSILQLAVVPVAGWGYSDLGGETALAVADAVLPVALELFAVRGDVFAFAVFFVVAVVALVEWAVLPLEFT